MAATFSEGKTGLDDISREIRNARALLDQARSNPTSVVQSLDALAASTQTLRDDIDAAALAAPNDRAIQNLKADKDKLVQEFTAKRAEAVALQTAVAGV